MTPDSARSALITAAMVVAGIRLWMQIRGKTTTPFAEWVVGWGALFFVLALLSEVAPTAAASLALLVLVADFLKNGVSLTGDISSIVTGSESGSILTDQPFGSGAGTAATSTSKSTRENVNPQTFKSGNF